MQSLYSTLESLIEHHAVGEEPMSFHNIHGFLTALAICPVTLSRSDLMAIILDGELALSDKDCTAFDQSLSALENLIDRAFSDEQGFNLSFEANLDTPEDIALQEWCTGFMEGHLLAEERWFEEHEQEVCELLLPLMLASGLFDDEPEFIEILKDQELTADMCSQIPEVLTELYLLFNAPEDTRGKKDRGIR